MKEHIKLPITDYPNLQNANHPEVPIVAVIIYNGDRSFPPKVTPVHLKDQYDLHEGTIEVPIPNWIKSPKDYRQIALSELGKRALWSKHMNSACGWEKKELEEFEYELAMGRGLEWVSCLQEERRGT